MKMLLTWTLPGGVQPAAVQLAAAGFLVGAIALAMEMLLRQTTQPVRYALLRAAVAILLAAPVAVGLVRSANMGLLVVDDVSRGSVSAAVEATASEGSDRAILRDEAATAATAPPASEAARGGGTPLGTDVPQPAEDSSGSPTATRGEALLADESIDAPVVHESPAALHAEQQRAVATRQAFAAEMQASDSEPAKSTPERSFASTARAEPAATAAAEAADADQALKRYDPLPAWRSAGSLLIVAWAIGVLWQTMLAWRGYWAVGRLRAGLEPLRGEPLLSMIADAARRIGLSRPPRAFLSSRVPMPMILGAWRPVLVLPQGLLEREEQRTVEDVLLHEMAHIQRRDVAAACTERAALALFWWNPLVRAVCRRLGALREEICDNAVLLAQGEGVRLARCLVEVAIEATGQRNHSLTVGAVRIGRFGLEQRVRRLLDAQRLLREGKVMTRLTRRSWIAVLFCTLALGSVFIVTGIRSRAEQEAKVATPDAVTAEIGSAPPESELDALVAENDYKTIFANVKAYREEAFRSARIDVIRTDDRGLPRGGARDSDVRYATVFDGGRVRQDGLHHRAGEASSERLSAKIATASNWFDWSADDAAGIDMPPDAGTVSQKCQGLGMWDPRFLGTGVSNQWGELGSYLRDRPERELQTVRVDRERLNGREMLWIWRTWSDGMELRVWVDPERGWAVPRIELIKYGTSKDDVQEYEVMTADYIEWPGGGPWFPKEVRYEVDRANGKDVRRALIQRVETADFDADIPDEVFTREGLENSIHADASSLTGDNRVPADGATAAAVSEQHVFKAGTNDEIDALVANNDWKTVVANILAYREQLRESAAIQVRFEKVNQYGQVENTEIWTSFFQGECVRQDDYFERMLEPMKRNNVIAINDERWLVFTETGTNTGRVGLVDASQEDLREKLGVRDLILLGTTSRIWYLRYPQLPDPSDTEAFTVTMTRDTLDRAAVLRMEKARDDGYRLVLWVDPGRGWAIMRMEAYWAENSGEESKRRCVMTAKYAQWSEGGRWFPEHIESKYYAKSGPPRFGFEKPAETVEPEEFKEEREIVTVEAARFGVQVDPAVFTREGCRTLAYEWIEESQSWPAIGEAAGNDASVATSRTSGPAMEEPGPAVLQNYAGSTSASPAYEPVPLPTIDPETATNEQLAAHLAAVWEIQRTEIRSAVVRYRSFSVQTDQGGYAGGYGSGFGGEYGSGEADFSGDGSEYENVKPPTWRDLLGEGDLDDSIRYDDLIQRIEANMEPYAKSRPPIRATRNAERTFYLKQDGPLKMREDWLSRLGATNSCVYDGRNYIFDHDGYVSLRNQGAAMNVSPADFRPVPPFEPTAAMVVKRLNAANPPLVTLKAGESEWTVEQATGLFRSVRIGDEEKPAFMISTFGTIESPALSTRLPRLVITAGNPDVYHGFTTPLVGLLRVQELVSIRVNEPIPAERFVVSTKFAAKQVIDERKPNGGGTSWLVPVGVADIVKYIDDRNAESGEDAKADFGGQGMW